MRATMYLDAAADGDLNECDDREHREAACLDKGAPSRVLELQSKSQRLTGGVVVFRVQHRRPEDHRDVCRRQAAQAEDGFSQVCTSTG